MTTRAQQIGYFLSGVHDDDQALLNGSTVNFYEAGTTTPKNVWSDKAKTAPYTTISLDAIGQAQIYGEGSYKIEVLDGAGAGLYVWDNVYFGTNQYYVNTRASTSSIGANEDFVLADSSGGAITLTLPAAADATHPIIVKRSGGSNVTVDGYTTETIDGALTYVISADKRAVQFVSDGSNWQTSGVPVTAMWDADNDTGVQVEESDDEDVIRFDTGGTERANIDSSGIVLPDTSAIFGRFTRGMLNRPAFAYSGGDTAYTVTAPDGRYLCKDKFCWWDTAVQTAAIGTPAANTWYYLYLDYSEITSGTEIVTAKLIWSTTAPTWNAEYQGWYNGDDLCVWMALSNSVPNNIVEFHHDGGERVFWSSSINVLAITDIDATFTDVDLNNGAGSRTMPDICQRSFGMASADINTADGTVYFFWLTKGQEDTNSHQFIGLERIGTDQTIFVSSIEFYTDTDQTIQVKCSRGSGDTLYMSIDGFYLPRGM